MIQERTGNQQPMLQQKNLTNATDSCYHEYIISQQNSTNTMNTKRIIEVAFPVEEVSEQGGGKNQISGIHKWWARRPLGTSRATVYAALVESRQCPPPSSQIISSYSDDDSTLTPPKSDFIADLAIWENARKPIWIQEAQEDILNSHNGKPPKVLDPFGGGGSIPLEAQRLGCETYSCDLNPVAVLIQKCTLEYPQQYGQRLYDDVKKYGKYLLEQLTEEVAPYYPTEPNGSEVYAYIWARTLPCQNLNCKAVIPLIKQFWLAKNEKKKREIALFPYNVNDDIQFRLVGTGHAEIPNGFDPAKGTISSAIVTCPFCKSTISAKQTRRLFQEGHAGERLLVVATKHPKRSGKQYRLATEKDVEIFSAAQEYLSTKRESLKTAWGIDPVPDEPTPTIKGPGAERGISLHNYNFKTWGDLFNIRQQLSLVILIEKIQVASTDMLAQRLDAEYSKVLLTYLGMWLGQISYTNSNLCLWRNTFESVNNLFGMPTMSMAWDYGEANPLRIGKTRLNTLLNPLLHLCQMEKESTTSVQQASAQNLPYANNTFDAVFTDPPYYDNAAYAYLSDFFYVWLKRSIGEHYPELFKEQLTPKDGEIVAYGHREGGLEAGKLAFEDGLAKAFQEMHRVLKPNGIAVIVYAHKSTEGWETLINALLDSGLIVTGAWPVDTEQKVRWRSYDSAALTSSIYMVARKQEQQPYGLYHDVKQELESHLEQNLFQLWEWGFTGADLFIAAIGSGIEVFGKYREVLDDDDTLIRADKMIADIREILERFDGEHAGAAGTKLTRFYLRWRKGHGTQSIPFNDARELALSLGVELEDEWGEESFIQKEKTNVRVLGPHEREGVHLSDREELIDVLHRAVLLWSASNPTEMVACLAKDGIGLGELIWSVASQICGSLPSDNRERQWLEGWLADRVSIQRAVQALLETQANGS